MGKDGDGGGGGGGGEEFEVIPALKNKRGKSWCFFLYYRSLGMMELKGRGVGSERRFRSN